jgi:hypothetical protein
MDYSKITICSYCRNDIGYLATTLPTWLEYPVSSVVITDWGSTPPLADVLKNITNDNRVTILRVDDYDYRWLSKMKNLSGDYATTDFIFFIDPFIWLRKFDFSPDESIFYYGGGLAKGSCLIHKDAYWFCNGYNEFFITSVGTSDDFYARLDKRGFYAALMPEGMEHVEHEVDIKERIRVFEPDLGKYWGRSQKKQPINYIVQKLGV